MAGHRRSEGEGRGIWGGIGGRRELYIAVVSLEYRILLKMHTKLILELRASDCGAIASGRSYL